MFKRTTAITFLLGSCCLMVACGFQLRGTGSQTRLPDDWFSMYLVTANPNSELSREVHSRFAANGIQWADDRSQANYTVKLGGERFSQRNLSINAEARASEFELTMKAQFEVQDSDGRMVMEGADATVVRQMENDPRNVVGKAEEVRILKGEMRTDLSQQIMRRIGYFAASTQ